MPQPSHTTVIIFIIPFISINFASIYARALFSLLLVYPLFSLLLVYPLFSIEQF